MKVLNFIQWGEWQGHNDNVDMQKSPCCGVTVLGSLIKNADDPDNDRIQGVCSRCNKPVIEWSPEYGYRFPLPVTMGASA